MPLIRKFCSVVLLGLFAHSIDAQIIVEQCPQKSIDAVTYINGIKSKEIKRLDPFELLFIENHDLLLEKTLGRNFNINTCGGPFNSSLLGTASALGLLGDVEAVLARGANLERPLSPQGESPLILALSNNRYSVARYLMKSGANTKTTYGNDYRYTALDAISMSLNDRLYSEVDELEIAELLLKNGLSPNQRDGNPKIGSTPLAKAVIHDKPGLVKLFMGYGADPLITAKNGKSAIDIAIALKKQEILEILQKEAISGILPK